MNNQERVKLPSLLWHCWLGIRRASGQ